VKKVRCFILSMPLYRRKGEGKKEKEIQVSNKKKKKSKEKGGKGNAALSFISTFINHKRGGRGVRGEKRGEDVVCAEGHDGERRKKGNGGGLYA